MPIVAEPNPDFRDLLQAFVAAGVRFLVVGAHALAAHGIPRATQDLDIWIDATPENASRVWRALVAFGAPLSELAIEETDFTRTDVVVQVGLPPSRIDILTGISGVVFSEAWRAHVEGLVEGLRVPVLGVDALIQNKRAAARYKDLGDIEALERYLRQRTDSDH